ncbi:hypothetical protein P885DRAFT_37184 [Corynascus similis CBS 632.67]
MPPKQGSSKPAPAPRIPAQKGSLAGSVKTKTQLSTASNASKPPSTPRQQPNPSRPSTPINSGSPPKLVSSPEQLVGSSPPRTYNRPTKSSLPPKQQSQPPVLAPASQSKVQDVQGVRILVLEGNKPVHAKPGEAIFDCVASVISLAVDILECKPSLLVLRRLTDDILGGRADVMKLRNLEPSDFEKEISQYLRKIRTSFPHVLVSDRFGMETKNGRTTKRDCMGDFEPKAAAVIELSGMLVNRLVTTYTSLKAADSPTMKMRFKTLHVRLSLTVAHELVHAFNLYLIRDRRKHTPPGVTAGGYGNSAVGESGRFWERELTGGIIDMRLSANGTEMVALRDDPLGKCYCLLDKIINGLLARDFKNSLRPDGGNLIDREYKNVLAEHITPMEWKDRYTDMFPEKAKGPITLSPDLVEELVGPEIRKTPKHDISGQSARKFAMEPRRVSYPICQGTL